MLESKAIQAANFSQCLVVRQSLFCESTLLKDAADLIQSDLSTFIR